MNHEVNIARLARDLAQRRRERKLGVREVAAEIGAVSASTLSRIERGNLPDLDTYMKLCRWLEVPPTHYAIDSRGSSDGVVSRMSLAEKVQMQLRSDPVLSPATKDALITMLEVAYAAAKAGLIKHHENH